MNGKDTRFATVFKNTSEELTIDDKKIGLLTIQKTIEGSGFWLSINSLKDKKYQNQPLFLSADMKAIPNDKLLIDENLLNNTLILFLGANTKGKGIYARYNLTTDSDPNGSTNGSCDGNNLE